MDKWKDIELEKMKAGGNAKFRQFLESQEDYDPCWSLQDKYSSKAAALFRDKVRTRRQRVWAAPVGRPGGSWTGDPPWVVTHAPQACAVPGPTGRVAPARPSLGDRWQR